MTSRVVVTYKGRNTAPRRSVVAASTVICSPPHPVVRPCTPLSTDLGVPELVPAKRRSDASSPANEEGDDKYMGEQPFHMSAGLLASGATVIASPTKLRRVNRMKVANEHSGAKSVPFAKHHSSDRSPTKINGSHEVLPIASQVEQPSRYSSPSPRKQLGAPILASQLSFEIPATGADALPVANSVGITYGKSRSFLQASLSAEETGKDRGCDRGESKVDEGLESSDDDEEKKTELRNVHELRESGKATRFTDEVEYITSGLSTKNSLGMRRASYLELAAKVMNEQFLLKARAHNVLSRFCECIDDSDQIITTISLYIVFVMSRNRRNLDVLIQQQSILPFIVKHYKADTDILLKPPRSKYEKNFVLDIRKLIESSNLVLGEISNRTLALLCLESLFSLNIYEHDLFVDCSILEDEELWSTLSLHFSLFARAVIPDLCCKALRDSEIPMSAHDEHLLQMKAYLKIFQRILAAAQRRIEFKVFCNTSGVWTQIIRVAEYLFDVMLNSEKPKPLLSDVLFIAIHLLVEATVDDRFLSGSIGGIATRPVVRMILSSSQWISRFSNDIRDKKEQDLFDLYHLKPFYREYCGILLSCLELLANLVKNDDMTNEGLRSIDVNHECHNSTPKCCCKKQNALEQLVKFFSHSDKNETSAVPNTALAIFSAIIGYLTSSSQANVSFLRARMNSNFSFLQMGRLLEEFCTFHQMALGDGETAFIEGNDGPIAEETERIENAGVLKQMDHLLEVAKALREL
ncbi:hypothetical protein HDU84_001431 [Entophlyctis sp. JEL0112]|nr:hypothetical protein HDU84_001431 [Entophlyctis sp. JEL0112]